VIFFEKNIFQLKVATTPHIWVTKIEENKGHQPSFKFQKKNMLGPPILKKIRKKRAHKTARMISIASDEVRCSEKYAEVPPPKKN